MRIVTSDRMNTLYVPEEQHRPCLTVENCPKWYCLYLVEEDDSFVKLTFEDFKDNVKQKKIPLIGDHVFNPMAICEYAARKRWMIDDKALAEITRRWFNNYLKIDVRV